MFFYSLKAMINFKSVTIAQIVNYGMSIKDLVNGIPLKTKKLIAGFVFHLYIRIPTMTIPFYVNVLATLLCILGGVGALMNNNPYLACFQFFLVGVNFTTAIVILLKKL